MTEAEICTVQVATSDDREPEIMTITMTPNDTAGDTVTMTASDAVGGSVTVSDHTATAADEEGVLATTALQMVDCDEIIDSNDHSYRVVVTESKSEEVATEVCYEPNAKRQRLDEVDENDNIKALLFNMNSTLSSRLDAIESKMKQLEDFCHDLDGKVQKVNTILDVMCKGKTPSTNKLSTAPRRPKATIVGLPSSAVIGKIVGNVVDGNSSDIVSVLNKESESLEAAALGSNVTLITLNTEGDFPHGAWLGDPNLVQYRVRCKITPTDMLHIMETSRTADKCALKLMDYLFDREVQASSNLSGTGKHGKKQLDPLMIYGIRCHLLYKFGINEEDWHRIKLNIDSKCRTAFRRKQRGLPLKVKAFNYNRKGTDNDGNDSLIEDETVITNESSQEMQSIQIQYKLQELPDGQMAAVPTVPVTIASTAGDQSRVQMSDGQQIAISETTQMQIAQLCGQDIPPGSTLVTLAQVDAHSAPSEGDIVMRLAPDGSCLEQVQVKSSEAKEDIVEKIKRKMNSEAKDKAEALVNAAKMAEKEECTDVLVEIQEEDCVG